MLKMTVKFHNPEKAERLFYFSRGRAAIGRAAAKAPLKWLAMLEKLDKEGTAYSCTGDVIKSSGGASL